MTKQRLLRSTASLVAAAALAGCTGSGSSTPGAQAGSSGGPAASASGQGTGPGSTASQRVVQGVRLTADGASLNVGDTARVSWQPDQKRTGVIGVTVTGLRQVPMKEFSAWRLTGPVRRSTPYYVNARVRNLGRTDLSGVPVPLYVLDNRNVLLESSSFQAQFAPCPSTPFPPKFTHGRRASVCLVYFAPRHGTLDAVSFRPTQDIDGITWRGPVRVVKAKQR